MPTASRRIYDSSPVTSSTPHRLIAWACLAIVFLTGSYPLQGFIVCIESDGCVNLEAGAAEASCGGCKEHERSDSQVRDASASSVDAPCPCIDLAVQGSTEQQMARSRSTEIHVGTWIAPPPEVPGQNELPTVAAPRAPPACTPRVADSWEHLRTVVLLV